VGHGVDEEDVRGDLDGKLQTVGLAAICTST
jgi:hypothetical protein